MYSKMGDTSQVPIVLQLWADKCCFCSPVFFFWIEVSVIVKKQLSCQMFTFKAGIFHLRVVHHFSQKCQKRSFSATQVNAPLEFSIFPFKIMEVSQITPSTINNWWPSNSIARCKRWKSPSGNTPRKHSFMHTNLHPLATHYC